MRLWSGPFNTGRKLPYLLTTSEDHNFAYVQIFSSAVWMSKRSALGGTHKSTAILTEKGESW